MFVFSCKVTDVYICRTKVEKKSETIMAYISTKKTLSAKLIDALKSGHMIRDTGDYTGLCISCTKTGVKTFFFSYRAPNVNLQKRVTLGVYVTQIKNEKLDRPIGKKLLGLAAARQIIVHLREERKAGDCPATRLKKEALIKEAKQKAIEQKEARLTVKEIVELYLTQKVEDHLGTGGKEIAGSRKLKGQKETRRTLEAVVGKDEPTEFGRQIAEEIRHTEIKKIISGIVDKGTNVQAGNVLRELKLAFGFCIGKFDLKDEVYLAEEMINPCIQAKQYFKDQGDKLTSNAGIRTLKDTEITKLLKWLPRSKYTQVSKDALMLVLFTGVRSGEAVVAKKEDFDLEKGTWFVIGKTKVERHVQLSVQAIEYIRPIYENKENKTMYLLPTKRGKPLQQKKLSEQAWKMRKDGDMLDIPRWTAHDLRRTVRTQLSRLTCPSPVGEAVLGHSKKGLEGVYDLHEYESECAIWLQKLADHYDELGSTKRECFEN